MIDRALGHPTATADPADRAAAPGADLHGDPAVVPRVSRRVWWWRVSLVVSLAIIALMGLAAWRANPVVFDDAFITYRYAENLANGHGPVYNPGERVEGYTNFLWMALCAFAIRLGADPFTFTRVVGLAAYVATFLVASCLIIPQLRAGRFRDLPAMAALLLLAIPYGLAAMAGTGLETSFASLLLLAMGVVNHVVRPARARTIAASSLLPLAALLTRMDSALFVAASAIVLFFEASSEGWRDAMKRTALAFGPAAVGFVVYLAWKWNYYGDILPNSYYAKAGSVWHVPVGMAYLRALAINSPQVVLLAGTCVASIAVCWRTSRRGFCIYAALSIGLYVVYLLKVGGDFMYYRFAFEAYPVLVVGALCMVAPLLQRWPGLGGALFATALTLSLRAPYYDERFGMQTLEMMDSFATDGQVIGKRMRATLPRSTRIATTLAGTIPFESKLFTIDQWGLNDREVARLPDVPITSRGHVKAASISYIASRAVNLYIGHPVLCSCDRPCREALPNVFIRIGDGRCLRTWYLTQTPELTQHFCAHPEWFVLNQVDCKAGTISDR